MTIPTLTTSGLALPSFDNADVAGSDTTEEARRAYAHRLAEHNLAKSPRFAAATNALKARIVIGYDTSNLLTADEFLALVKQD
jgi:hypothetical protein